MDSYKKLQDLRETSQTRFLGLDRRRQSCFGGSLLKPELNAPIRPTYEGRSTRQVNAPVQLEVYPNHDDFAVRTMGHCRVIGATGA